MPSLTLHLHLAERILDQWEETSTAPSFPRRDPDCRNAFLQGSLGPDLGYFPGGERMLSDYAHCLRSGNLARNLLSTARTPRERAYALGWLTHVLADRDIHPIIGRGVGELVHGRRDRRLDAYQDEVSHVRVETGVDAHFALRFPHIRNRTLWPVFDEATVVFLTRAYRLTYGFDPDSAVVLQSHRRATRLCGMGLRLISYLGERERQRRTSETPDVPSPARWIFQRAFRLGEAFRNTRSLAWAFLSPVRPATWILAEIDDAIRRLPEHFHHHRTGGMRGLPDYNLDSGRLESDHPDHPVTRSLRETSCVSPSSPTLISRA